MSRMFWFTVGASSGIYAMVKARRAAERLTPSGVADQLAAVGHGVRLFGDEVRVGMAEHETSLRARLERAHPGHSERPAIPPAPTGVPERVSN